MDNSVAETEVAKMQEELGHLQAEYNIPNEKFVELTVHVNFFNREFNALCAKITHLKTATHEKSE